MIGKSAGLLLTAMMLGGPAVADDGRLLFEPCRTCHALDPAVEGLPGPNLAGLLGRKVAGDPAFDYSPVLRRAREEGRIWTVDMLESFLADPEGMFPGMWMTARGIKDAAERGALARFIGDPASR